MTFNPSRAPRAAEATYTFEPVYPDGTPLGATITVRGPESAQVREVVRRQLCKLQEREASAKRRGRPAHDEPTLEDFDAQALDLAVAYTAGWSGVELDGQPWPASEANMRTLYAEHSWIRRQVLDEAQDLGNFVRPSSATSSPTPGPNSRLT